MSWSVFFEPFLGWLKLLDISFSPPVCRTQWTNVQTRTEPIPQQGGGKGGPPCHSLCYVGTCVFACMAVESRSSFLKWGRREKIHMWALHTLDLGQAGGNLPARIANHGWFGAEPQESESQRKQEEETCYCQQDAGRDPALHLVPTHLPALPFVRENKEISEKNQRRRRHFHFSNFYSAF